jgi:hypothetical protein
VARRAKRITKVSLVLSVVEARQPISIRCIGQELESMRRDRLCGTVWKLCKRGKLEVRGEEPRPDGRGRVRLYGIGTPGASVPAIDPHNPNNPVALARAEQRWAEVFSASSRPSGKPADNGETREFQSGEKAKK